MHETKQYRVSLDEMRQFQKAILTDKDCSLIGDPTSGVLTAKTIAGTVQLSYRYDGALLTVKVERKPILLGTDLVFNEIGLKIQQAAAIARS